MCQLTERTAVTQLACLREKFFGVEKEGIRPFFCCLLLSFVEIVRLVAGGADVCVCACPVRLLVADCLDFSLPLSFWQAGGS